MFLAKSTLMKSKLRAEMEKTMLAEINRLRTMTVGELLVRWRELYGEDSRSRNKDFLWRRLAWRAQELAHGGLSDRARARLAELAPDSFIRAVTPKHPTPIDAPPSVEAISPRPKTLRDIRLPSPGTVISRAWHGRELRLLVQESSFELDGVRYGSLSEAARSVTGQHWNGRLFWGVTQRKRRS